jgi:hypothetical protein
MEALSTSFDRLAALLKILSVQVTNDLANNFQTNLPEGPDSLIDFAVPEKFDEHLSLPRPGRRVRKELQY